MPATAALDGGEALLRALGSFLWARRRVWAVPILLMAVIVVVLGAIAFVARVVPVFVAWWHGL